MKANQRGLQFTCQSSYDCHSEVLKCFVDWQCVCRREQVITMGPVVTADTEMSRVMVGTALVTRDPLIETGDQAATMGTGIQTPGPTGRQARTAVNQHPGETETDGRVAVVLSEIETEGMTDL